MRMSGIHRLGPVDDHRPGIGDYDVELAQVGMDYPLTQGPSNLTQDQPQPILGIFQSDPV